MKKREFGNTGIKLSQIGLGCMGMSQSYGTRDDEQSLETLRCSLKLGINFWDTADIYGYGENEKLLAQVLKEKRQDVFLATKIGFRQKNHQEKNQEHFLSEQIEVCGSKEYIRKAINDSLQRLGVDYIDLLYLHRVDPKTPIEESISAMAEFVKTGKVKYLGLSECTVEQLERANKIWPISAVQSEYSILTRDVETNGILAATKTMGIAFIAYSPLARGLMANNQEIKNLQTGDFRKGLPRYEKEHLKNNLALAAEFASFAASKGLTAAQLALNWVLAQSSNIIAIPGTKRTKYLIENCSATDVFLNSTDLEKIETIISNYPNIGPRYSERENKFLKK